MKNSNNLGVSNVKYDKEKLVKRKISLKKGMSLLTVGAIVVSGSMWYGRLNNSLWYAKLTQNPNVIYNLYTEKDCLSAIDCLSLEKRKDADYMLKLIAYNPIAIEVVDKELLDDIDFMSKACALNMYCLSHASERLKNDADFMNSMIKLEDFATYYIGSKLLDDYQFMLSIISNDNVKHYYGQDSKFFNEPLFWEEIISRGYIKNICCMSDELKDNPYLMSLAMELDEMVLFESPNLRKNAMFMANEIYKNPNSFLMIDSSLMANSDFILTIADYDRFGLSLMDDGSVELSFALENGGINSYKLPNLVNNLEIREKARPFYDVMVSLRNGKSGEIRDKVLILR